MARSRWRADRSRARRPAGAFVRSSRSRVGRDGARTWNAFGPRRHVGAWGGGVGFGGGGNLMTVEGNSRGRIGPDRVVSTSGTSSRVTAPPGAGRSGKAEAVDSSGNLRGRRLNGGGWGGPSVRRRRKSRRKPSAQCAHRSLRCQRAGLPANQSSTVFPLGATACGASGCPGPAIVDVFDCGDPGTTGSFDSGAGTVPNPCGRVARRSDISLRPVLVERGCGGGGVPAFRDYWFPRFFFAYSSASPDGPAR